MQKYTNGEAQRKSSFFKKIMGKFFNKLSSLNLKIFRSRLKSVSFVQSQFKEKKIMAINDATLIRAFNTKRHQKIQREIELTSPAQQPPSLFKCALIEKAAKEREDLDQKISLLEKIFESIASFFGFSREFRRESEIRKVLKNIHKNYNKEGNTVLHTNGNLQIEKNRNSIVLTRCVSCSEYEYNQYSTGIYNTGIMGGFTSMNYEPLRYTPTDGIIEQATEPWYFGYKIEEVLLSQDHVEQFIADLGQYLNPSNIPPR